MIDADVDDLRVKRMRRARRQGTVAIRATKREGYAVIGEDSGAQRSS